MISLVAVVLLSSCGGHTDERQPRAIRVTTEVASVETGQNGPSYVGIVEENEATAVSFTTMGVVKRVYVDEGQAVSRGQLLAEIDDTQARNMLSGAQAAMAQADDAMQRYGMLHDNGSLPEVQWVEIQSKVAQAKAQLEAAKKQLADCRLIAPVGGIIGKKQINAGETAMPSQAVVSILDIGTVKVKVAVPEAEVGRIAPTTHSSIKVDAIGRIYEGGHIEKGVSADALTHTYDLRINVNNRERKLLPGMVASVTFVGAGTGAVGGSVSVPLTSVQKNAGDGSLFVWTVAADSTAHRTAVAIGPTFGNRIVVTGGLTDGQRIVAQGYQKLSEGTKVIF